jgi:hypothetical protein
MMASRATGLRGLFENVEMNMERAVAIKKLGKLLGKTSATELTRRPLIKTIGTKRGPSYAKKARSAML